MLTGWRSKAGLGLGEKPARSLWVRWRNPVSEPIFCPFQDLGNCLPSDFEHFGKGPQSPGARLFLGNKILLEELVGMPLPGLALGLTGPQLDAPDLA